MKQIPAIFSAGFAPVILSGDFFFSIGTDKKSFTDGFCSQQIVRTGNRNGLLSAQPPIVIMGVILPQLG